jgi:hypothetical protein
MERYWKTRARPPSRPPATTSPASALPRNAAGSSVQSEYDRHRSKMMAQDNNGGWEAELRRYLAHNPEVTKETDIVEWWQVCSIFSFLSKQYSSHHIRTIVKNTRHLPASLLISSPCKRPRCLANACFRQVSKPLMIAALVWVPRGSKNFKS